MTIKSIISKRQQTIIICAIEFLHVYVVIKMEFYLAIYIIQYNIRNSCKFDTNFRKLALNK
uniref:Uncharacterized protein n=1 Tax=Bacteriophage sp. TaxID=38018 RepID=A0A8D9PEE7_9VIRU|nr:MAG TPA: hypothetical protein [Bacteriophage sp.]